MNSSNMVVLRFIFPPSSTVRVQAVRLFKTVSCLPYLSMILLNGNWDRVPVRVQSLLWVKHDRRRRVNSDSDKHITYLASYTAIKPRHVFVTETRFLVRRIPHSKTLSAIDRRHS
jgi:hypothetical protein